MDNIAFCIASSIDLDEIIFEDSNVLIFGTSTLGFSIDLSFGLEFCEMGFSKYSRFCRFLTDSVVVFLLGETYAIGGVANKFGGISGVLSSVC